MPNSKRRFPFFWKTNEVYEENSAPQDPTYEFNTNLETAYIRMLQSSGRMPYTIQEIRSFIRNPMANIEAIVWQALIGGVLVTVLEFITGLIVNIWLGLNVWDYSKLPLNLMGQICLPFFFAWVGLSVVAIVLDDYFRYWFFGEEKPHYTLV